MSVEIAPPVTMTGGKGVKSKDKKEKKERKAKKEKKTEGTAADSKTEEKKEKEKKKKGSKEAPVVDTNSPAGPSTLVPIVGAASEAGTQDREETKEERKARKAAKKLAKQQASAQTDVAVDDAAVAESSKKRKLEEDAAPAVNAEAAEAERKRRKKEKKEKRKAEYEAGEEKSKKEREDGGVTAQKIFDDEALSEHAKKALHYVHQHATAHLRSAAAAQGTKPGEGWKFSKARQGWLMRHYWSVTEIPESYVDMTIGYLKTVQSGARSGLIETAKKHANAAAAPEKSSAPEGNEAELSKAEGDKEADEKTEQKVEGETETEQEDSEAIEARRDRAKRLLKAMGAR